MVAFFVTILLKGGGFQFFAEAINNQISCFARYLDNFLISLRLKNSLAAKQLNNFLFLLISKKQKIIWLVGLNNLNYIFIKWLSRSLRVFLY